MPNNVGDTEFWKVRLKEAWRIGELHKSVYNTIKEDWEFICKVHKTICDRIIIGKVLDVGCGYGRLSEWFRDDYSGIDFSEDFIKKAKELYPRKEFIQGDIKDMPYVDKEFDWAVCISIKEMVERELGLDVWQEMKKEIMRVAKKVLVLEYSNPAVYTTYEEV